MQTVSGEYSFVLVAVSLVVAAIGSFVAFHTLRASVLNGTSGTPARWKSIALASVMLGGVGIWAMHFVGMLALRLPVPHGYALLETLSSLAVAIAATAAAFSALMTRPNDPKYLLISALLLGLGVCAMHYIGMFGMRFEGYFLWSLPTVLLSLVLSVAGSAVALWLVFAAQSAKALRAAPVVMAAAVSSMHYVAMGAADFVCSVGVRGGTVAGRGIVGANDLSMIVIVSLLVMVAVLTLDQWLWASPQMSEGNDPATKPDASDGRP